MFFELFPYWGIPFYGRIIFHGMGIPHFVFSHSAVDGELSYFHPLATVNSVAGSTYTEGFVSTPVFNSFGSMPRHGISGQLCV